MPRLPTLSGREVVRVFQRFGWQVVRQSSSHIIMVRGALSPRFRFQITEKWRKAHSGV
jgi:predicted RNA binding protein YcfA (HicA-like mRNA interferase family)